MLWEKSCRTLYLLKRMIDHDWFIFCLYNFCYYVFLLSKHKPQMLWLSVLFLLLTILADISTFEYLNHVSTPL